MKKETINRLIDFFSNVYHGRFSEITTANHSLPEKSSLTLDQNTCSRLDYP